MNLPITFDLAVGLALAGVIAAAFVSSRYYRGLLRYDPARAQSYDFTRSDALVAEVEIRSAGFAWPEIPSAWDTAFLEVCIRPRFAGGFFDPSIVAVSGPISIRQYLERGSRGSRYLNLSAFAGKIKTGASLGLAARGVRIPEQHARLVAFQNPFPRPSRVLVAAPHPDDAEIAAFGLYSRSESCVVTLTSGEQGGFLGNLFGHSKRLAETTGEIRVWDSITVPRLGGVAPERSLNLCHADGALEELFANQTSPARTAILPEEIRRTLRRMNLSTLLEPADAPFTWRSLIGDLTTLLKKFPPELIVTPHPLLDEHSDHGFATVAVCEAVEAANLRAGWLLLHVTHSPWTSTYPAGETDGTVSLPPHFGEATPFRSVCSIQVTLEEQLRKHLAIEGMHDLRTIPAIPKPAWSVPFRGFLAELRSSLTGLRRDPNSFLRRAVRPNELFFVVPFAEAAALRLEYLHHRSRKAKEPRADSRT